ncbi:uncharacterized protein BX663DRAFT_501262 [Cokeromyces recurvatus]|uniref:uncharacterized protein n=1 Tax=Cokeromyces recurvatus TaxID=90255 RepID=UPI00221E8B7F|nr:uncharacterized protein BX663DRAFT_501262 [Cokeromyces recurvatus]KAI7904981.1 hypothetical protein BX663DRAFT_501262 [Cokeromyces recurvatus]
MLKFNLDPFPKFTRLIANSVTNARILIFAVVIAKITLDRLYKYSVIINPLAYDADGEPTLDILEYQSPSTANEVYYALKSYGAKGRQAYLTYLFYDVIFAITRTVPITALCTWAFKDAPRAIRPGVWLPILNLVIDLIESFSIFGLLKTFPHRNSAFELFTAFIIHFKKLTFKATLALAFISMLVGIYYKFHSLLSDSVVLEKDRKQKQAARDQVQDVIRESAARRAATSAALGHTVPTIDNNTKKDS